MWCVVMQHYCVVVVLMHNCHIVIIVVHNEGAVLFCYA